MNPQTYTAVI